MNAFELADKLQNAASSHYGELCGALWDGGAMLRNLHTESMALRCTEMALRDRVKDLEQQLAARVPDEPMFWVRLCSDGMYEGPIHHKQIERVRQQSGAWSPLYLGSQPVAQPEQPAIPAGKVLVPLRMNAEMERVAQEEGWAWADMLAAAEATTLDQDAIARRSEPEQTAELGEPVAWLVCSVIDAAIDVQKGKQ